MTKSQETETTVKTQPVTQDKPKARLVKGTKKEQTPGMCRPGAYA
jgi:hypothetical protein